MVAAATSGLWKCTAFVLIFFAVLMAASQVVPSILGSLNDTDSFEATRNSTVIFVKPPWPANSSSKMTQSTHTLQLNASVAENKSPPPISSTVPPPPRAAADKPSITTPVSGPRPSQCSPEVLSLILYQLPPENCAIYVNAPWTQECSFSYATRCPQSVWLEEYFQKTAAAAAAAAPRTAVFIGCNKAMDAVNTLRMLSGNPRFDKSLWSKTLFAGKPFVKGVCLQEEEDQFNLSSWLAPNPHDSTVVHCIEAIPVTANSLNATSYQLGWQSQLQVRNMAMGGTDGSILFPGITHPKVLGKIGAENAGQGDCGERFRKHCKDVPLYRLDSYDKLFMTQGMIDYLSVDTEGLDWDILLSGSSDDNGTASSTLDRVAYLEFEYNWMAGWSKHKLSSAITLLKERHDFVCYWPGKDGLIWRITDCWLDHYDLHFWANVACVNYRIAEQVGNGQGASNLAHYLAVRMEQLFHQTMLKGGEIRFDTMASYFNNGRKAPP